VIGAFGASAEFVAGTQRRAPRAVARVGAEWLYRLVREPRRLARRYLAEGPRALAKVARDVRSAA
jgi:exopolysaccharide biosynthesis WecB/TagA/CpsF family protein